MHSQPTIRQAISTDAATLAALGMQVWLHTYATEGVSDVIATYVLAEFTAEKFQALLDDPQASIIVAEIDDNLVGYVVARFDTPCPEPGPTVEIETLYVQEHFTRSGIGRALLHAAQAEAERNTGSGRVWLTVNIHNTNAIGFYESQGFVRVGTTYFELGSERHENHLLVSAEEMNA